MYLIIVNSHQEEQRSIPAVNNLVIPMLNERALKRIKQTKNSQNERDHKQKEEIRLKERDLVLSAGKAFPDDLALKSTALVQREVLIVLRQSRLALLVHQQHESDPHPPSSSMNTTAEIEQTDLFDLLRDIEIHRVLFDEFLLGTP